MKVVGLLADVRGIGVHEAYWMEGRAAYHERSYSIIPAAAYLDRQPVHIGVDWRHSNRWIGTCTHLERDQSGRLWAIAEIFDDDAIDRTTNLYWSPTIEGRSPDGVHFSDVTIRSLAVTPNPASVDISSLKFDPPRSERGLVADLLRHADKYRHDYGPTATIHHPDEYVTRSARSAPPVDTPSAWADRTGRRIVYCRLPRTGIQGRPRLMWNDNPVGAHAPELDAGGALAFTIVHTLAANEALALVADGVLDRVAVHRDPAGRWRFAALVP